MLFYLFFNNKGNTLYGLSVKDSFQILFMMNEFIKRGEIAVDIFIYGKTTSIKKIPFSKVERQSKINRYGTTSLLTNYKLKYTNFKFARSTDNLFAQVSVDDCAKRKHINPFYFYERF
jgi:hypothetical protein